MSPIQLKPHQQVAVDWATDGRAGAALFLEQGTGKTYVAAGIVDALRRRDRDFCALIVVPLANVETTWVRVLGELGVETHRAWESFLKTKSGVLLLHYEAFKGSVVRRVVKRRWSLVVYDESQRLKARGSKASRAAARFRDVGLRVILSGTPIEQSPQDLWAQFRFALPEVLGERWAPFKERWLRETGYMGYELQFRDELLPQFLEIVGPHVHRVLKSEVLDLPPLTYKRFWVDLLGEQARVYREVTDDGVATVGDRTVTCDLAITQLIRQSQVTGGFVRLDPSPEERARAARRERPAKGPVVRLGGAKIRALRRILARVELPVVAFAKHSREIAEMSAALADLRVGIVSGKRKRHRAETVRSFQRGELDVLLCQIKAGGVGIDLFRACTGIFYSCTFSSIDFDQAVCRLHRMGQTRPVTIWLIQARGTVDKRVHDALVMKRDVVEQVLDEPRRKTWARRKRRPPRPVPRNRRRRRHPSRRSRSTACPSSPQRSA